MKRYPYDYYMSQQIRNARLSRGLTSTEASRILGFSKAKYSRFETASAKSISEEDLQKICRFYKLEIILQTPGCDERLRERICELETEVGFLRHYIHMKWKEEEGDEAEDAETDD